MASSRWKTIELQKCRALGAERSGPTGRDLPDCDDKCHVALEVKSYKRFVWLTEDWKQAKENAAKVGKPPVLAVKERGVGKRRDMVQMREADWLALEILANFAIPEQHSSLHEVNGEPVIRMSWEYFVRLYTAAYNDERELLG